MKNIHSILSEFGITVPDDKKTEFDRAVAENYKTSAEFEKKVNRLTDDLTAANQRADTAEETLKGFEGKDFDAITRERDEWKRKHDENEAAYKKANEKREFDELLTSSISEAKGRNPKAIMALLDIETLQASKNQQADIKAALDAMRTESGYLFDDNGGTPKFTAPKSSVPGGAQMTLEDIMKISDRTERRAAMAKNQHLFTKKGE